MTPNQLSKRALEATGHYTAVVERWNPHARVRQDLWGFGDLIAFHRCGQVLIVQATSRGNMLARVRKVLANPVAREWSHASHRCLRVEGWFKRKNRWTSDAALFDDSGATVWIRDKMQQLPWGENGRDQRPGEQPKTL